MYSNRGCEPAEIWTAPVSSHFHLSWIFTRLCLGFRKIFQTDSFRYLESRDSPYTSHFESAQTETGWLLWQHLSFNFDPGSCRLLVKSFSKFWLWGASGYLRGDDIAIGFKGWFSLWGCGHSRVIFWRMDGVHTQITHNSFRSSKKDLKIQELLWMLVLLPKWNIWTRKWARVQFRIQIIVYGKGGSHGRFKISNFARTSTVMLDYRKKQVSLHGFH